MQKASYRKYQNFMLFLSIFVLGFSFYIEVVNQLRPCPLCFMQRACAFLFGFTCMMGMVMGSLRRVKMLALLQCVLAGLGLYFASRQLYLQSNPGEFSGQCLPGLSAMMSYFSWDMIVKSFVWGTADCSHVDWQWYGISIPLWSAIYFAGMLVISIFIYVKTFLTQRDLSKL